MVRIRRGDIVRVNLEPVIGSEQGGVRPALIIQNDVGNEYGTTTIIAPITSNIMKKEYPTNVQFSSIDSGLKNESTILLNQIRTIDKKRINKKIGFLSNGIMKKVDEAIKVSLALN
ncbi:MAG: type II toxin-antitoxin system PemK/MazF family toxin [Candidatus Pacearchaeota archaeon]|nr:type II toxin-antitoxin system PemK/MazF family toxin [Candidatus Pacearchaeota archaeon]